MRKVIIDTDVCSDDAAALILALKSSDVDVLAITTVNGGVRLDQATLNALMTIEVVGEGTPVYVGEEKPLFRNPFVTVGIHGSDGMGGCGLIHPVTRPVEGIHACDAILDLISRNPGEIDLIELAPATNIGLAVQKDRETMEKLHSITIMGTAGLGPGNVDPVAEANVYTDAEAFEMMLGLNVPKTILGFDLCIGESAFTADELQEMTATGSSEAEYIEKASSELMMYNLRTRGVRACDICDAVAMGCYLWPEIILKADDCSTRVCMGPYDYGQVLFYTPEVRQMMETNHIQFDFNKDVCRLIRKIDAARFKQLFKETITA